MLHFRTIDQPRRLLALLALLLVLAAAAGCSDAPETGDGDIQADFDSETDGDDENGDDGDSDRQTDGDGDGNDGDDDGDGDGDRPPPGDSDDWDWDDEFTIQTISPARGPLAGGTQFQISGAGLSSETRVLFDTEEVPVSISQGQLIGLTPRADAPGPVTVRVISDDGELLEIQNGFTYSNPLSIQSITPDRVPTTGGVEITLQGEGFVENMGVSFDGVSARRITVLNSGLARVVVPAHPRGRSDLRVSIPDESTLLKEAITFFAPLSISEVQPGLGDVGGDELITLRGTGFTPTTTVSIDDIPASIESVSVASQRITFRTPPAAGPGPVDIYLENDDDAFRLRNGFTYDLNPAASLAAISPAIASTAGGSEHLISGRGLDAPDAALLLGTIEATILESGPDFARIQAPPHPPGLLDIILRHDDVEAARLDDALAYAFEPSVSAIIPDQGSADGGEVVTITGAGLSEISAVSFGGIPAAFTIVDDETLEITTPPSEPGAVELRFHSDFGSFTIEDGFRFLVPLEIWSMRPSRGAIAGGTLVTIQGRGFEGLIEVEIAGQSGREIRRIDPYTITFRTPPASTGAKDVFVASMGEELPTPYPFVYFNPMSSFGGASGPAVDGAVNVTVVTNAGVPIPGAFVMLSTNAETPYKGFTDPNGQVTLSGPDVLGSQTVTATAAEFSTYTARHVDAQNLTLVLNPIEADGGGGQGTPPPIARISGNITITGKSEDPGGGEDYNMSMIRTTRPSRTGPAMNPGPNSIVEGEGPFSINSRVGDLALVALCGSYEEATDTFTPKFMAVERFLFLSDGDHQQVDLDCNIPLEESLAIKIVDPVWAPDGPILNEIYTFLDFGYEGYFRIPGSTQGLNDLLVIDRIPALEGVLHDLSYSVTAGSYNGLGIPYTQTWLEDLTDLSRIHSTSPLVAVPEFLSPARGGYADGEIRLGLKGVNEPDFYYIILRNGLGLPVWTFVVPGYETTIPLPEFPDFSDLPAESQPEPFQPGVLYATIYGIRIDDFNFHGFTNRDFATSRWSGFSVATWQLRLTP